MRALFIFLEVPMDLYNWHHSIFENLKEPEEKIIVLICPKYGFLLPLLQKIINRLGFCQEIILIAEDNFIGCKS